jgi:hypothetical protein
MHLKVHSWQFCQFQAKGTIMTKTAQPVDDLYTPETVAADQVTLAVKMPAELRDAWNKHCESKGVTMSAVLRRFIERELQK